MGLCCVGAKLNAQENRQNIIQTIKAEATSAGVDQSLAVAVAIVESGLEPRATGALGEQGLFQIKSGGSYGVIENTRLGIRQLSFWKSNCPVKENNQWLICYNSGFRHPKHPEENAYYKKVIETMRSL